MAAQQSATSIDKVRIVVCGDSGVGKSSLVHLICYNQPITNPAWTIGCATHVKLHPYKEGTPEEKNYFVELLDVGGSATHANSRANFYHFINGIILVHDITNKKSRQNLHKWLSEIVSKSNTLAAAEGLVSVSSGGGEPVNLTSVSTPSTGAQIPPVLVIATKLDVHQQSAAAAAAAGGPSGGGALPKHKYRTSSVTDLCSAEEIQVDCHQVRYFAPGTTSSLILTRFFDKVIESKFYPGYSQRKRFHTPSTGFYHPGQTRGAAAGVGVLFN